MGQNISQAAPRDDVLEPPAPVDPGSLAGLLAQGRLPAAGALAGVELQTLLGSLDQARPLDPLLEVGVYQAWIEGNPASPLRAAAWFNMGVRLAEHGEKDRAAQAYQAALDVKPDFHAAAVNLGLVFEAAGQPEQALDIWQRATQPEEARIALETQRGRLLEHVGRYGEAEEIFRKILALDPNQADVQHHWLHLRQRACRWPVLPQDGRPEYWLAGCGPFGIMALTDDIELQSRAAGNWVARKTKPAPRQLAPATPYGHQRLRIGYLSSDFCRHAMGYLISELFERHDRTRFEIYGYCSSNEDGSALRQRILGAFDHVRLIRTLPDEAAAELIRQDEIDVLIDLNGITDGSRIAVLRWRPAPIQATYLGFVGPLPLPELDYILCDEVVIPPEYSSLYGGRALAVGPFYQANDSKRSLGAPSSRAQAGLPEDRFILCCFSKHYKITEEMFGAWMDILRQAPRTVLWLAADNAESQASLLAAARAAGVAQERLIFSERTDPDQYMSRLALPDLFLDTFPYNAGTVASDALRMGLPLVTLCGRAFAARMATSLLHALGATQGIATSYAHYVRIAVQLANDEAAYASYKTLFSAAAWRESIGNIERFAATFEATLQRVAQARCAPSGVREAALASFRDGLAAQLNGGLAEAQAAYRRALALWPDFLDASHNLGTVLLGLGAPEQAAALFAQVLAAQPDNAMARGNLGKALQDLGRFAEARAAYAQAASLQPDNPVHCLNLGAVCLEQLDWEGAEAASRQALALEPEGLFARVNLARALLSQGRWNEAGACVQLALSRPNQSPLVQSTLAGLLVELGEAELAVELAQAAAAAAPDMASAWFNLSHAQRARNRLPEAVAAVRRALALVPGDATYHFHLGQLLLLQGELAEGWAEYEWRWQLPSFQIRDCAQPQWRGEDLTGRTILVDVEQGLGDIIQFARYIPLLAGRAGKVLVAASAATQRLLGTMRGVEIVDPASPPDFDVFSPVMSLPLAFGTTLDSIPVPIPYLHPPAAEVAGWRELLPGAGLRVGLVWAGNPATARDRYRSPGFAAIAPLLDVPGVTFVLLQKGPGREALAGATLPDNVLDAGKLIEDLADTAAIMAGLDLVISSCTAPLHLAGALGVKVWAMLPFTPHFPWLLEREDTLWYPTMRLFRQAHAGQDWAGVTARLHAALGEAAAQVPA